MNISDQIPVIDINSFRLQSVICNNKGEVLLNRMINEFKRHSKVFTLWLKTASEQKDLESLERYLTHFNRLCAYVAAPRLVYLTTEIHCKVIKGGIPDKSTVKQLSEEIGEFLQTATAYMAEIAA
jgi:hypothetical protein